MTKFIHADMVNGNRLIDAGEIDGIEVDKCVDMNDVRRCLRYMGDQEGEIFERVLEIPDELVDQIAKEYGCLV